MISPSIARARTPFFFFSFSAISISSRSTHVDMMILLDSSTSHPKGCTDRFSPISLSILELYERLGLDYLLISHVVDLYGGGIGAV